ncbi:mesothelin isoform X2 [Serinus canaria]|uniref:mesothelin isoform X2 n=1 Tax=Serinus canaria TaxID=9135 RepID=UPI0021CCFDF7|nr:mesothelin isoform X2 [Serinus canaria]
MSPLLPGLGFLLLLLGCQGAAAAGTELCSSSPVNESAVCASVPSASQEQLLEVARGQRSPCSLSFGQLACAQGPWLQDLQDDFLLSLFSCLASKPSTALDPEYSILFFSKYDARKLLASLSLFSQQSPQVALSQEWSLVLLSGLWERMLREPGVGSPAVLLPWLRQGLLPLLPHPRLGPCLRAKRVSCQMFQLLVAALDGVYSQLSVEEQRNLYSGIKQFLTQPGPGQSCHSPNSTAWFRNFLGSFLEHATVEDLQLFGDEATLQKFARDPENVELVGNLTLLRETAQYYTLLLTSAPALPLASLPDRLLCYLSPGAVANLSREEALGVAQRLGRSCPWSRGMPGASLAPQELQVASSLLRSLDDSSPAMLAALGQAALGLSVSRIQENIPEEHLEAALPALGRVQGWRAEQARAVVNKLLSSGYQILDGQSLAQLGTLVGGLNSSTLWSLSPEVVLEALQLPGFAQHVDTLPSALKRILVEKVSSRVGHPAELVKLIPSALASSIPKSLLVFGEEKPNLQDLNSKPWSREQAAMFFSDVVKAEPDFNRLSQSVLQGFTCAAASTVGAERVQELARVMRKKKVRLGQDQLSCLLRMVTLQGTPQDWDTYPQDLLLFLSPSDYAGNCSQFFTNVGKANEDVLPREAPQRQQLLLEALECLGVSGTQISKGNAEILGWLVCELGEEYIRSSGGSLLKDLSQCGSFLPEQEEAIRDVLSSGNTTFGPPAAWSAFTLSELSRFIPVLGPSILQQIPKKALTTWLRNFAWDSHLSREELATVVGELLPRRHKRAEGCPAELEITEAMMNNDLMNVAYTPEQLRACLRNISKENQLYLESHLSDVLAYPFSNPQLAVLKDYLHERYPDGYPDSVLSAMGPLLPWLSPEEISSWRMSSAATLAAFLGTRPPDSLASAAIKRYLELGNALNATALDAIGTTYVCLLNATQLKAIDPSSLKLASLDPSACSQETKNLLYQKAKEAFSDQHRLPAYYELILPYLGGAPAADLKVLSKDDVNMNVSTFVTLRRDSLMLLTPREVQGLLGVHLPELAQWQSRAPVRNWLARQKQSELDKLQVGLTGGVQEGYINLVTPKFPETSSAPLGSMATVFHLLPALLLSFLTVSILS